MSVIIYRGWICQRQYNDKGPFAWTAYCENDPEQTASESCLDYLKEEIDFKIEDRQREPEVDYDRQSKYEFADRMHSYQRDLK